MRHVVEIQLQMLKIRLCFHTGPDTRDRPTPAPAHQSLYELPQKNGGRCLSRPNLAAHGVLTLHAPSRNGYYDSAKPGTLSIYESAARAVQCRDRRDFWAYNLLRSQCLQVQPVTCWNPSVFLYRLCLQTETMHQLLLIKSKFPNHFAFTLHAIFGPVYLMWMSTIVIYLFFIVVAT